MTTVEEDIELAQEYERKGAHVAAFMTYQGAIAKTGYDSRAPPILDRALDHAPNLKKNEDRAVIASWAQEVIEKIGLNTNNAGTLEQKIAKLKPAGEQIAAPP